MLPDAWANPRFAVDAARPNRIPRQASLRDGGQEWRSIGRLREVWVRLTSLDNRERRYLNSMARNLILHPQPVVFVYPNQAGLSSRVSFRRADRERALFWIRGQ